MFSETNNEHLSADVNGMQIVLPSNFLVNYAEWFIKRVQEDLMWLLALVNCSPKVGHIFQSGTFPSAKIEWNFLSPVVSHIFSNAFKCFRRIVRFHWNSYTSFLWGLWRCVRHGFVQWPFAVDGEGNDYGRSKLQHNSIPFWHKWIRSSVSFSHNKVSFSKLSSLTFLGGALTQFQKMSPTMGKPDFSVQNALSLETIQLHQWCHLSYVDEDQTCERRMGGTPVNTRWWPNKWEVEA